MVRAVSLTKHRKETEVRDRRVRITCPSQRHGYQRQGSDQIDNVEASQLPVRESSDGSKTQYIAII